MDYPVVTLLIGMGIVVGGVLALRLHPFLALVAGGLAVAALTPAGALYRFGLRDGSYKVVGTEESGRIAVIQGKGKLTEGMPLMVLQAGADGGLQTVGGVTVIGPAKEKGHYRARVPDGITYGVGSNVFLDPRVEAQAATLAKSSIGERLGRGFGETAMGIGILIAMAAIVGQTLLESGGAERIVGSLRRAVGDSRAGLAFLISGFILGIPVFFDTVFYLLIPIGKVMAARTKRDYTLYVLCIIAGATMTHSLVPPTPGPLFVARELNVNMATMILGGLAVGAVASASGFAYAFWANRKFAFGVPDEMLPTESPTAESRPLPGLFISLLPILLPVLLITGASILERYPLGADASGTTRFAYGALMTLGEKNVSMTIAAGIGLLMMVMRRPVTKAGEKPRTVGAAVSEALADAGVIILITSAGGAFGYVLRQTDIGAVLQQALPANKGAMLMLLPIAFLITTAVRTAQGSATVAMITAAGVMSPIVAAGPDALGFHPVYLALAIGCGSKPVMWMNDSGFWIIGKMSGLTPGQTLRTATVMMLIMGVMGLAATVLGAWIWPGI
ncbi:MAG: GntP family permease [Phycisphaerae bacterium]